MSGLLGWALALGLVFFVWGVAALIQLFLSWYINPGSTRERN